MAKPLTLPAIARAQDEKIRASLAGDRVQTFWFASCPPEGPPREWYAHLHALGFDNYPLAALPAIDALQPYLFFFERIFGAQLLGVDSPVGDFFHTWCLPLIRQSADVFHLAVELDASPLWNSFETAISEYLRATPVKERLPVLFPGLSPLDMGCNLCGAEQFFLMLYDAPDAAAHLLEAIVTLQIAAYKRVAALGARPLTGYGFPGVYCNDLQMPYLSPAHITRFVLPCYARLAAKCGGVIFGLLSADLGVLQTALRMDGLLGCLFDKSLPLGEIKKHLGRKLFLLPHYMFDESFDRPTVRDGVYYNPIVQSYSRELPEVYRAFACGHNLLISIERTSLAEVCALCQELMTGKQ